MQDKSNSGVSVGRTPDWIGYIDAEVTAVCQSNGWHHQIRRKWSARATPVRDSPIDDYEWKLIPTGMAEAREAAPSEFDEGTYFVLGFDSRHRRFLLQHDTDHCGIWDDRWLTRTYTELQIPASWQFTKTERIAQKRRADDPGDSDRLPPEGWLRRLLLDLTARFRPNHFSAT